MRVKKAPLFRAQSLRKGQIQIQFVTSGPSLYMIHRMNPLHDLSAAELCTESVSQVRSQEDNTNTTLGFTLESEIEELFSEISSGIFCGEGRGLSAEIHIACNWCLWIILRRFISLCKETVYKSTNQVCKWAIKKSYQPR